MGNTNSNTQSMTQFNTLINALIESKSDEKVINAIRDLKPEPQMDLLPEVLTDFISLLSIIFIIASTVFIRVKFKNMQKELNEFKQEALRCNDKQDRTLVIHYHYNSFR